MGFAKPIEQYLFSNLLIRIHVFMYLKDIIREGYFMNSQARKQNGAIFFPANGPSLIDKIYFEKHAIPYEYPVATTVVRKKKKIGRNEPCPCGSGKKFKKCCIEKGIYD